MRRIGSQTHPYDCIGVRTSSQVKRGEVVALLGPNGSGKTTSFYAIAGLIQADGGKVSLDGNDISALPMYRRARLGIGYLPQEMSIFRGLNVQNLDLSKKSGLVQTLFGKT